MTASAGTVTRTVSRTARPTGPFKPFTVTLGDQSARTVAEGTVDRGGILAAAIGVASTHLDASVGLWLLVVVYA